jgi:hypothetical protein
MTMRRTIQDAEIDRQVPDRPSVEMNFTHLHRPRISVVVANRRAIGISHWLDPFSFFLSFEYFDILPPCDLWSLFVDGLIRSLSAALAFRSSGVI